MLETVSFVAWSADSVNSGSCDARVSMVKVWQFLLQCISAGFVHYDTHVVRCDKIRVCDVSPPVRYKASFNREIFYMSITYLLVGPLEV